MSDDPALLIGVAPGEARWALEEAGAIVELGVERARAGPQPGDLFLGRVTRLMAPANAAFVDLGGGASAFLNARHARAKVALDGPAGGKADAAAPIAALVTEGEALVVQIRRAALDGKDAQATTALTLAGPRLVLTPGRPGVELSRRIEDPGERERLAGLAEALGGEADGIILRTAALGADAATLGIEADALRSRWQAIAAAARAAEAPAALAAEADPLQRVLRDQAARPLGRIVLDAAAALPAARAWCAALAPDLAGRIEVAEAGAGLLEDEGVEAAFEEALARSVTLPGGGRVTIEPTAALVAIDVDTGSAGGARPRAGQDEAALAVNLEAAAAIARQLRLRNLGGLVAIDFLRLRDRGARARLLEALRAGVAPDPIETAVGGFTRFGLVEATRRRARASLGEAMGERTQDGGWRVSAETVALDALRGVLRAAGDHPGRGLSVAAAPAVVAALEGALAPAHAAAEAALGLTIALAADGALAHETFDISPA